MNRSILFFITCSLYIVWIFKQDLVRAADYDNSDYSDDYSDNRPETGIKNTPRKDKASTIPSPKHDAYSNYYRSNTKSSNTASLRPRSTSSLLEYLQPDDVHRGGYDDPNNIESHICTRTCVEGDSKICYYRFTFEAYSTLGKACNDCLENITSCYARGCVTADGFERAILTVNRMLPAPSIQVCEGDTVVVDVKNKMSGRSTTIHWHGHRQVGTPWFDGVPMVTQCPINECEIFRYILTTDDPGLNFYHSHDGLQKVDGLTGAFVIRQPKEDDPNRDEYDYDLPSHVIVINDWYHKTADSIFPGLRYNDTEQMPVSYLINGRGVFFEGDTRTSNVPVSIFHVTGGNRYVFRIIAATCFECQYEFTIGSHDMVIIGTDKNPAQPTTVNALIMSPGERYSVVVNANQNVGSYWIHVRAVGYCEHTEARQVAILHYRSASPSPRASVPRVNESANTDALWEVAPVNSRCEDDEDGFCVVDLRSTERAPEELLEVEPDVTIHWGFGFHFFTDEELYNNPDYPTFLQSPDPVVASYVNGIVNSLPPSPLLTQYNDIPENVICDPVNTPMETWDEHRECAHIIKVPMNSVVEIIIFDLADYDEYGLSHAIHLHGYDFYIIEQGAYPEGMPYNQSLNWLQRKLAARTENDIPEYPVQKDTFALTSGGYTIVRILTDNPGFWFFHCHFAYHLDSGMSGILQVGELSDFPSTPSNLPKCGDYLPLLNDDVLDDYRY
uniref:Laccase n=1 Tax=Clastoptera arizonana TaxID=38151 RepID=A0A1B6DQZ8_9HEMI